MRTKVLLFLIIAFFTISCEKDEYTYIKPLKEISACGKDDPLNQLEWLNSKILKGKDPSTSNFIENIWIKKYGDEDVIVIDFGLTSSMYSTYDCTGNSICIDNQDFFNSLEENELIYKYVIES